MWLQSKNAALAARMDQLERDMKNLRLDADSWYDKFRSLFANQAQRQRRAEKALIEEEEAEQSASQSQGNGQDEDLAARIPGYANMDPISRKIHERRARMFQSAIYRQHEEK